MTAVDEIFELGSALSTKSLSLRRRDRPLRLVLPPAVESGLLEILGGLRLRLAATINIGGIWLLCACRGCRGCRPETRPWLGFVHDPLSAHLNSFV